MIKTIGFYKNGNPADSTTLTRVYTDEKEIISRFGNKDTYDMLILNNCQEEVDKFNGCILLAANFVKSLSETVLLNSTIIDGKYIKPSNNSKVATTHKASEEQV